MPGTDRYVQIGQVLKSNGTDGQVVISLRSVDAADISGKEPVFIFFDELPVPYFIKVAAERGASKILAYLTDVDSLEDAEELVGRGVFVPDAYESEEGFGDFTGWTLKDADGSVVGKVDGIEDIPGNPCLIVGESLIPLHEDLVVEVDEAAGVLVMDIPEGLI